MDVESSSRSPECRSRKSYRSAFLLAYQSFGVVYGDLSISPIYVYKSTFFGKLQLHEDDDEVLGVLSLVFWTLTLVALLKYTLILLEADDNGEGGTFALYSSMCRNSKLGILSDSNIIHENLSAYKSKTSHTETRTSLLLKSFIEKHQSSRIVLLFVVLLGTSMVIGDGVLTPTMSVLSAVSGIRIKVPELHENVTVLIACIVLMGLFALQHFGTHHVGFLFAPILISWFGCISGVGIYNIIRWNPSVGRALSPYYIYNFFKKTGKDGWSSLGGIVLCITGAEAMFADLGHFSKLSIRMAFTVVVYPCLVLAYMGEAAYLSKHPEDLQRSFFKAIPESIFWPFFVIATLATIVGSQAIITAAFSIISQCRALGCFPRVKIIHTSNHIHGQIYIPEVNWLLMLLCLAVTLGFRDTDMIGNAYGLAVVIVMLITTCLMFLIITTVWRRTVLAALAFTVSFGCLEAIYLSACLAKVPHGGWLPLALSLITLSAMVVWHYGAVKKRAFELQNKVSLDRLLGLGLARVSGVGLVFSAATSGVPPMFAHFVTNFPAAHRTVVFVCVQTLVVPRVLPEERFSVRRVGPPEHRVFRCVVRYGYKDRCSDSFSFENRLFTKLAEFLQQEGAEPGPSGSEMSKKKRKEVRELAEEREAGVAYIMGQTCVEAHESSSLVKKLAINVYGFLRRNSRQASAELGVPQVSLIEVGMVYYV